MFFNKIGKNNKKRVSVYFSPEEWSSDTHSKRLNSFVDGLSSDYEYKMIPYYTDYKKTEYIVIHGWKKIYDPGQYREYLIDSHNNLETTIVLENCYLPSLESERYNYTAVGIGNFNGRANFKNDDSPSDRFEMLNIEFNNSHDWRRTDKILIIGQYPNDAQLYKKIIFQEWLDNTYNTLIKYTDKSIYFRPHPWWENTLVCPEGCKLTDSSIDINQELKNYYAVITYNSNTATECVINSIPVFSFDRYSMAYDLSYHDLSQIENLNDYNDQDRLQWLYNLAYSQWTLDEMKQGLPHKHLGLI